MSSTTTDGLPTTGTRELIGEAFWLSANAIVRDSSALLPQLLGRLEGELPSEITAGWRARDRSRTWLCPLTASLTRPGGPLVQTLTRRQLFDATLSLSDDGDVVALGGPEQVEVIHLSQRETVGIFRAEAATLTADGRSVVVGLCDSVTIIDIATKATIFRDVLELPIVDVAITPDGRWVAATAGHWMMGALPGARNIDSVHVWDVERGGEEFITVTRGDIRRFLLTADGRHVVLGRPPVCSRCGASRLPRAFARWQCSETDVRALVNTFAGEIAVASAGGTCKCGRWIAVGRRLDCRGGR